MSRTFLIVGGLKPNEGLQLAERHIERSTLHLTNVTSGMGVLSVMGPRSREFCIAHAGRLVAAASVRTSRLIELGYARCAPPAPYVGDWAGAVYPTNSCGRVRQ